MVSSDAPVSGGDNNDRKVSSALVSVIAKVCKLVTYYSHEVGCQGGSVQ